MNQSTHFAPLNVILPHIEDDHDHCVLQLQSLLESEPALERVHLTQQSDKPGLCIHYDPDQLSLDQVRSLVTLTGGKIADQFIHETLHIEGMDCGDCANIIEHALEHLPGVLAAKVGYASQQLRIEYDNTLISSKEITKKLKRMGYQASKLKEKSSCKHHHGALPMTLFAGVFLIVGFISSYSLPILSLPAYLLSIVLAGGLTFRDSIQTLLQKRFDVHILMVLAALGAILLGAWGDAALLLFLFSLGHALEHKAMHHAQDAVKSLAKLSPTTALVLRNGQELTLNVREVEINDHVLVKPGERIPVDGRVLAGHSSVDQASITGESLPVEKSADDSIFAGSINGEGALTVLVTKRSEDSTIHRMVRLVLEADTQKSPTQRFTDQFVKRFVPLVLAGVSLLIVLPPLFFGLSWSDAFYRAMAVLVASSPCALAISTPAAVLSAVARAAQRGVLIKGGAHLENLGSVQAIAFDKTGTLTYGKPTVKTLLALNTDENTLLQIAASVEKFSHHPLAKAIVLEAKQRQLQLSDLVRDVQQIPGKGIRASHHDSTIEVGARRMFDAIPADIEEHAQRLLNAGQTIMLIKQDDQWLGLIGLADTVRQDAAEVVKQLHTQLHLTPVMLTGDNDTVAKQVAQDVNIERVHAGLLPADKLNRVSQLEAEFGNVAMVGDGINDAPALARASVGIAMGGAGSDVALEAADVSLMADDLTQLPFAMRLARRAAWTMKLNLWIALGVVVILLGFTATGLAGIGPAIVIHEGSTLLVVANALRLLRAR